MKITEKQLMVLFDLAWKEFGPIYSREIIKDLVDEIMNQNSDEIKEIE